MKRFDVSHLGNGLANVVEDTIAEGITTRIIRRAVPVKAGKRLAGKLNDLELQLATELGVAEFLPES